MSSISAPPPRTMGRGTEAEIAGFGDPKKVLGQNHLQILVAMAELAILWRGQGRCEEAMDLMKQAETLQTKGFGL